MRYFPLLRGKQYELIAVRALAKSISRSGLVIPILEPVNSNNTTMISIDKFMEESMPFLFICNPIHGTFAQRPDELINKVISRGLCDYDNWIPALYVDENTALEELSGFKAGYAEHNLALIYYGSPQQARVRSECATDIDCHVFVDGRVRQEDIQSIRPRHQVILYDPFRRQQRNANYRNNPCEFFTDKNTLMGNQDDIDFGDFSIVGDHFSETGGPAHAVALHHVHFAEDSRALMISHFVSDRTETRADPSGKTIEAVNHLVEALDTLQPNGTEACEGYREMSRDEHSRGLGYMKRLAIQHHLEVILGDGGLGS